MCESQFCFDLWANILGGIAAALILAAIYWGVNLRRHFLFKSLIKIMGEAIAHRNDGERGKYSSKEAWVTQADDIVVRAENKAQQISNAAGALVKMLDRVDRWDPHSDFERSLAILSKVIIRMRELIERNS